MPPVDIHVGTDAELKFGAEDELACDMQIVQDADGGRVSIMDLPPPTYPKRGVVCQMTALDGTTLDVVFSGNLRPFYAKLDHARVPRKSVRKNPGDAYPEIFYALMNSDVKDGEKKKFLLEMPTEIFCGAPVVLKVLGDAPKESVASFIASFRTQQSIFPYGL